MLRPSWTTFPKEREEAASENLRRVFDPLHSGRIAGICFKSVPAIDELILKRGVLTRCCTLGKIETKEPLECPPGGEEIALAEDFFPVGGQFFRRRRRP